ncbi:uncharacterized protein LOC125648318 [Ostrea edulis]|uniref:uncharacterized protein LOC125648318 n=1 Tax=Ostrea edulis TaxID=37623 RepID=UPI0024AEAA6A|nr:uncharacterized protein LOC125648318 [Ostrea edulis]XP_055997044.1 uncharacterized protein LOC125648318 [Ostrea edulis]
MSITTNVPDEKRTFLNKLHRLRGDLESYMLRIDAPYHDVTETDKRRYCVVVIELLEFAVKRAENLPTEISFQHLPTWNNLHKENRSLKKQLHTLNTEQMRLSVLLESANRNLRELHETDSQTTTTEDTHEDLRSGVLLSRELDAAYKSLFPIEEVSSRMEKDSTPTEITNTKPTARAALKTDGNVQVVSFRGYPADKPFSQDSFESPRSSNRGKLYNSKTTPRISETKSNPRFYEQRTSERVQNTPRKSFNDSDTIKTTYNPQRKKYKEYEKNLQNTIENMADQNSELLKQNRELQTEINRLMGLFKEEKMAGTLKKEAEDKELLEMRNQLQGLWKLVQTLETERKYLINRLGRLANSRVGDDDEGDMQTFIADLSDLVRPTALGLRLSELYNNEWTFAYESMISKVFNERKVVMDLLSCITNIYMKCKDMAEKQRRKLHRESKLTDGLLNPDILLEVPIQIIELQRERALDDLPEIKQTCRDITANLKSYPKQVIRYLDKCTELCWFMNIRHPPLVFEWQIPQGSLIDTTRFTFYTRSGRYVDYVVWPALLLTESGAVLSKGVVQGRG